MCSKWLSATQNLSLTTAPQNLPHKKNPRISLRQPNLSTRRKRKSLALKPKNLQQKRIKKIFLKWREKKSRQKKRKSQWKNLRRKRKKKRLRMKQLPRILSLQPQKLMKKLVSSKNQAKRSSERKFDRLTTLCAPFSLHLIFILDKGALAHFVQTFPSHYLCLFKLLRTQISTQQKHCQLTHLFIIFVLFLDVSLYLKCAVVKILKCI